MASNSNANSSSSASPCSFLSSFLLFSTSSWDIHTSAKSISKQAIPSAPIPISSARAFDIFLDLPKSRQLSVKVEKEVVRHLLAILGTTKTEEDSETSARVSGAARAGKAKPPRRQQPLRNRAGRHSWKTQTKDHFLKLHQELERPGARSSSPLLPSIFLGDLDGSKEDHLRQEHIDSQILIMVFYDMDTLQQRFETDRGFQITREEILAFAKGLNEKANAAMLGMANYEETERKIDEWIAFLGLMQECKLVSVSPNDADRISTTTEEKGGQQASAPPSRLPSTASSDSETILEAYEDDSDDLTLTFPSLSYDTSSSAASLTASPPSSIYDNDDDASEIDPFMHMHSCEDCSVLFEIPTIVIGEKGVESMAMMEDTTQKKRMEDLPTPIPIVSLPPSLKKPVNAPIDTNVEITSIIASTSPPSATSSSSSDSTKLSSTASSDASSPTTTVSNASPATSTSPAVKTQDASSTIAPVKPAAKSSTTTTVVVKQETIRVYAGSRNSALVPKATRHPDRTKPFAQQLPFPPCNKHYLLARGCPAPDCKYMHDFLLTSADLDKLRTDSKRTPCFYLMRHLPCPEGKDRCHMGHICPHGRECTYGHRCKFTLEGMHDGPAILPPLPFPNKPRPLYPSPLVDHAPPAQAPVTPAPYNQPRKPFRIMGFQGANSIGSKQALSAESPATKMDRAKASPATAATAGKTTRIRHR